MIWHHPPRRHISSYWRAGRCPSAPLSLYLNCSSFTCSLFHLLLRQQVTQAQLARRYPRPPHRPSLATRGAVRYRLHLLLSHAVLDATWSSAMSLKQDPTCGDKKALDFSQCVTFAPHRAMAYSPQRHLRSHYSRAVKDLTSTHPPGKFDGRPGMLNLDGGVPASGASSAFQRSASRRC